MVRDFNSGKSTQKRNTSAGRPSTQNVRRVGSVPPVKKASSTAHRSTKKPVKKKKGGLFQKLWVKVTAFILAGALLFTGGYHLGKHSKVGNIINNNISSQTQDDIQAQDQAFLNLIKKSTNEDQKQTMTHQSQSLDVFNRDFANKYVVIVLYNIIFSLSLNP